MRKCIFILLLVGNAVFAQGQGEINIPSSWEKYMVYYNNFEKSDGAPAFLGMSQILLKLPVTSYDNHSPTGRQAICCGA